MLYTSYISKITKLPDNMEKIIISRFIPKSLDINKYNNTFILQELSPSKELLLEYKRNNDWNYYVKHFVYEMNNRKDLYNALNKLYIYLKENNDVCLLCYEKDYIHCHRYLLAQYFVNKGIEWKEI